MLQTNSPKCSTQRLMAIAVVATSLAVSDTVAAAVGSQSNKRCGVHVCDLLDFCSPLLTQCEPCRTICEPTTNHFDEDMCKDRCESYIYERHLINATKELFHRDIDRLQRQQTLLWIVLIIVAALFVLLNGARCLRWMQRHGHLSFKWLKRLRHGGKQKPAPDEQMTHANPHTNSPKLQSRGSNNVAGPQVTVGTTVVAGVESGALRIQRQASTVHSINDHASTVQTVSTPISRHPAEDSTESFSYDNAGLQVTPTTSKPKSESTF